MIISNPALPQLGSSDIGSFGLIEALNQEYPGFIQLVVDGGAGIGSMLDTLLSISPSSRIIAYEPLPENAEILKSRFAGITSIDIRQAALGSKMGMCKFEVPASSRIGIANSNWIPGTSPEGAVRRHGLIKSSKLLAKKILGRDQRPSISVKMVRMDLDLPAAPDFLKLDLQGGEPEAIEGLGHLLYETKIIKCELELFASWKRTSFIDKLRKAGFAFFIEDFLMLVPKMTTELREILHGMGLEITHEVRLYGSSSSFLHAIGRWPHDRELPIYEMRLRNEFAGILAIHKAIAFQVDFIALNNRYGAQWKSVLPSEVVKQAGLQAG